MNAPADALTAFSAVQATPAHGLTPALVDALRRMHKAIGEVLAAAGAFVSGSSSRLETQPVKATRGRPRLPTDDAEVARARHAARERQARRRAAQRDKYTASERDNSDLSRSPGRPPRAVSGSSSRSEPLGILSESKPHPLSSNLEEGRDNSPSIERDNSGERPSGVYRKADMTQRAPTKNQVVATYLEAIRAVVGKQWSPREEQRAFESHACGLAAWLFKQEAPKGPGRGAALLRANVERFARAMHASPLVKKRYEPEAALEWLTNHGIEGAKRATKPEVVAPWLDEQYERPGMADYDSVQRLLAGIPLPTEPKSRDEQLEELERFRQAAE